LARRTGPFDPLPVPGTPMNVVPPPPPTPGAYSHTTPAGVIVTSKTMHLGGDTAGRGGVRTIKGERGPDGTTVVEITGVLRTPIRPRSIGKAPPCLN